MVSGVSVKVSRLMVVATPAVSRAPARATRVQASKLPRPDLGIALVHDEGGLPVDEHVQERIVARDHRHAAGHCLEHDRSQVAELLRHHEDVAPGEKVSMLRRVGDRR